MVEWKHLCNFGGRHHEDQFCEIILNLDQWFSKKMSFEEIFYLELWQLFCSAEWNHLCDLSKGHCEEQFFGIILNLD